MDANYYGCTPQGEISTGEENPFDGREGGRRVFRGKYPDEK